MPWPRVDDAGEPLLDAWRALSCDDVGPVYDCDTQRACPFFGATCVVTVPSEPGVCVKAADCSDGLPLAHRDGACSTCTDAASKAALCCAEVPGIDCRAWPFEHTSAPGEPCAEHDDCEPGLLCASTDESSFPVCVCPNVDLTRVLRPNDCGFESSPTSWGEWPTVTGAPCLDAEPGWADTLVTQTTDTWRVPSLVRDAEGKLHAVIQPNVGPVRHVTIDGGEVNSEDVLIDGEAVYGFPGAIAVDARGFVHFVAQGSVDADPEPLTSVVHVTNESGTWTRENVLAEDSVFAFAMAFDPSDHLVIAAGGEPAVVATLVDGSWSTETFYDDFASIYIGRGALAFTADGDAIVYWETGGGAMVSRRTSDGFTSASLYEAGELDTPTDADVALAKDGTPHLVWDKASYADVDGPPGYGEVRLYVDSDAPSPPVVLFRHDNRRFITMPTRPQIAIDPDGRRWVAHRAPEGIALLREGGDGSFTRELILRQAPDVFELAIDGRDEPHLLYVVGGFGEWDTPELRHVHRGSCMP